MAPLVVKDKVLVGNSGREFGVRGWLTALNLRDGSIAWRAYSTGPDKEVLIGSQLRPFYPSDRAKIWGARSRFLSLSGLALSGLFAVLILAQTIESEPPDRFNVQLAGADPQRAGKHMQKHGCVTCHTIPGIIGARGRVGPPLAGVASRQYLAGMLPNTPGNMLRWIQTPQDVNPATAMPNMGVNEH